MAGQPLVLSTRRVLGRVNGPLWVGRRGAIVALAGAAMLGGGPDAPADLRALDAGFGLLSPASANALGGERAFLSLGEIDLDDVGADAEYDIVSASGANVRARPASADHYRAGGVSPATHLVLHCERLGEGGAITWLQGCGVWRRAARPTRQLLSGTVIDAAVESRLPGSCLVATRPGLVVAGIAGLLGLWPGRTSVRRSN